MFYNDKVCFNDKKLTVCYYDENACYNEKQKVCYCEKKFVIHIYK